MFLLDLDFNYKGLDGAELEGIKASHQLANMLAGSNKGDAAKMMSIATDLYKDGKRALDKPDLDMVKEFVQRNEMLTNLAKAQLLDAIKGAKETKE